MSLLLNTKFLIRFTLFIICFLLLTLAFEGGNFWILGLVGLAPFFVLIENSKNWKSVFLISWVLGILIFMVSLRWMLAIFPNESLGLNSDTAGLFLIASAWFLFSLFSGLGFAIFGVFVKLLNVWSSRTCSLLTIPSAWIIAEYLRAWIFSLAIWGEGALIGPFFTFNNMGYLLADTPFFYFARMGGLYGLSFLVVMTNAIIFLLLKKKYLLHAFAIIILIFLSSYFYVQNSESYSNDKLSINVLLLGIPPKTEPFYREGFLEILEGEHIAPENQPDIVVFPEGFPLLSISGELENSVFSKLFPDQNKKGFVVANKMTFTEKGRISEIIYRDSKGNLIARQEKSFLIPGGETAPIVISAIAKVLGMDERIKIFRQNRQITKSAEPDYAVGLGDTRIGAFLCSGILAPDFSRRLVQQGAEILINSASHNLWQGHPRISNDLELMARFEAMAHERPILQATYGGPSFVIDEKGAIIKKSSLEKPEIFLAKVYPKDKKTLTARIGDLPIIIFALLAIIISRMAKARN